MKTVPERPDMQTIFPYQDEHGKWFWREPGSVVVNGPFSSYHEASDDLILFNEGRTNHIISIARACHEANKAFCELNGDFSQSSWDDALPTIRQSAISGVEFHLANPGAGDSASHDSWMAFKIGAGYVYGPVKDDNAFPPTHPCLIPFEALPPEQQFKDKLFRTIVHAFRP